MLLSAEARWFWPSAPPPGLEEWFCSAHDTYCRAGGGETRVDEYLRDAGQRELGLKRRGGKAGVEVKGLVAVTSAGLAAGPFVGSIELWVKWTSHPLDLKQDQTIATKKVRWLRKFDTNAPCPLEIPLDSKEQPLDKRPLPALGCNVELTQVSLLPGGEIWWTLAFEAFGTMRTVENDLRAVATVLVARRPPGLEGGFMAGYPAWLSEHARRA
jgi:hypothetical protein